MEHCSHINHLTYESLEYYRSSDINQYIITPLVSNKRFMTKVIDLPTDILNYIASLLNQLDLISLNLMCRSLYSICTTSLYSNIYITDKNICLSKLISRYSNNLEFANWSIIRNSLNDKNCDLKFLERSLADNPTISNEIKNIITDDITFILFKLKFWYRKYFMNNNNLKQVFFGNIPISQLNVIYDDIFSFYTLSGINLNNLQLKSLNDLIKLEGFIDHKKISTISFNLMDTNDIELNNVNLDLTTRNRLILIFNNLKALNILSIHNLSLRFLLSLSNLFPNQQLFNNLIELSLNHNHGHINNQVNFISIYAISKELKLDFKIIEKLVNFSKIKKLNLQVDCNHVFNPRSIDELNFNIDSNFECCNCLNEFFLGFKSSVSKFHNLGNLIIIKSGQSVIINPFSLYYFKHQLITSLGSVNKLDSLIINTNSHLYPIYNFTDNVNFNQMCKMFINQNIELVNNINRLHLKHLNIVDYFESFHLWDMTAKEFTIQKLNQFCECIQCESGKYKILDFLKVNKKIQFYLNPITNKSSHEFYFDLISFVLSYHKNFKLVRSTQNHSVFLNEKSEKLENQINLIPFQNKIMNLVNRDDLDLHQLFKHDDYKDLINYKYVKNLISSSDKEIEITCQCSGNEFNRYIEFLRHQIRDKVCCRFFTENFQYGTITLNNLNIDI